MERKAKLVFVASDAAEVLSPVGIAPVKNLTSQPEMKGSNPQYGCVDVVHN